MSLFEEMEALSRTVDRMLARHGLDGTHGLIRTHADVDDAEITERDDAWSLAVDLPGFQRSDVAVTLENGVLTLKARRDVPVPEGARLLHRERRSAELTRTFRIPPSADAEGIRADLHDGVLTLTVPKRNEVRSRSIEIRSA